ncbi:hypothetical protein RCL1_004258 [Eukaryota sp. TZLM3-RCL]
MGKIGVFGGDFCYTGAPFFAAMAALRAGADLSYIVCAPEASVPIKSYAPDLIVYPSLYDAQDSKDLINRMDVCIFGPGYGRSEQATASLELLVPHAMSLSKVIVLDGDALWYLSVNPDLISYPRNDSTIILTPNIMEFTRIYKAVMRDDPKEDAVEVLAKRLNCFILAKGPHDIVCTPEGVACDVHGEGSPRRHGGQGDILCGLGGLYSHWSKIKSLDISVGLCEASKVTRKLARLAYAKHGRSVVTSDFFEFFSQIFD